MSAKGKTKRILATFANVLLYSFWAVCLGALVFSAFSRKSDGAVTLFDKWQMRVVISPSMAKNSQTDVSGYKIKSIPTRSMVFVRTVPEDPQEAKQFYDDLKVGDVLTFKYVYSQQETITHRLVQKEPNNTGGYILHLKGDNASDVDAADEQIINTDDELGLNYVVGIVTGQSRVLGLVAYALQQPVGIALIVIVPAVIIIILEVVRIAGVVAAARREKAEQLAAAQTDEIAELKKQLSQLRAQTEQSSTGQGAEQNVSGQDSIEHKAENSEEQNAAAENVSGDQQDAKV